MKSIFIIAALLIAALASVNAQYMRTTLYKDSTCTASPAYLDMYVKTDNCASSIVPVTCVNSTSVYTSLACASAVPVGGKNTLQVNIYADNTCGAISISQILPIDTCISSTDGSSMKSTGCKTMTLYSDADCKTVKNTVDYAAFNGVCNLGTKYLCNNAQKIGLTTVVMMVAALLSIVF
ncbi:predicted protein [Naegleria gruberi]|uniref:Predicted protein n=1 Tax=Naegleria gruberi TaxID=5762 RepID=D2V418_NAEGR|nr:uncharacterized protein NAEGRDRAFT_63564 [Naegleria gruberi]EFC48447.1 predicted protein [Naegleria gruberi]|eukprot:XP_002681191.1 predicted protein [Naegleria gruberi strain NEG-M]